MPLIIGVTAGGVLVPVQVDASGVVAVDLASALPAGNNNIGNVDVVTLPALPIGTNEIGKIQARSYGLIGGSFQKDPIRLGYSGPVYDYKANTNLSAGSNNIDSDAVAPGEIWVITNIAASYTGTVGTAELQFQIDHNGTRYFVTEYISLTSGLVYGLQGFWVLDASDFVRLYITNATATDAGRLYIIGYRVDIDQ